MRILPHHQDTGGFFVAVLEKVKPLPWEHLLSDELDIPDSITAESKTNENENENVEDKKRHLDGERISWGPQRKRKRVQGYREDPFVFFKEEEDVWPCIK